MHKVKYTLQENAMSSFHIAIENFKKFFYNGWKNSCSENDEARKLCAIFLENSIELFLKALLVEKDEMMIYKSDYRAKIERLRKKYDASLPLEDLLAGINENFQTITYTKTINLFQDNYFRSEIMDKVLKKLGIYRNRLTHFGINDDMNNEFSIVCIEAFVVIYDYLYNHIKNIDKISEYMVSDDILTVSTIHGPKKLIDDDGIYNNVIDFLDELTESSGENCLKLRIDEEKYRIKSFYEIFYTAISSESFKKMKNYYNVSVNYNVFESGYIYLDLYDDYGLYDTLLSDYSSFYNATTFFGNSNEIFFRILHYTNKIIIYKSHVCLPRYTHKQFEPSEWNNHIKNKQAYSFDLSQESISKAFEKIFIDMMNFRKSAEGPIKKKKGEK